MKVIKIYDKNSDLRSYNRNIFRTTEAFLAKFPHEYGDCYRHNLETLELFYVDKFVDKSMAGCYNNEVNVIYFASKRAMGHELFHMASNDMATGNYAFSSKMEIEDGLIEGMTEYFTTKAYGLERPGAYPFEVFCVTMLEDIPNIFKPYFVPSNKEFISLFPNRRDIYSLLYSLDVYNSLYLDFLEADCNGKQNEVDMPLLRDTIKDAFSNLVEIKLSMENDPDELRKYELKFMEYAGSDKLSLLFEELYPNYFEYVDKMIDKKIRKRKI